MVVLCHLQQDVHQQVTVTMARRIVRIPTVTGQHNLALAKNCHEVLMLPAVAFAQKGGVAPGVLVPINLPLLGSQYHIPGGGKDRTESLTRFDGGIQYGFIRCMAVNPPGVEFQALTRSRSARKRA